LTRKIESLKGREKEEDSQMEMVFERVLKGGKLTDGTSV